MKPKNYTIALILLSISITCSAWASDDPKWHLLPSGKYYFLRFNAFDDGYGMIDADNFSKSYARFRKSLTNTHRFNFAGYNNYAVCAAKLEKYDQALGLLTKCENVGGIRDYVIFNKFMVCMNAKRYELAATYLDSLSYALRSSYPEPVGTCLLMTGKFQEAFQALHSHISTDSVSVSHETYYNASLAAFMINDTVHAANYILQAVKLSPRSAKYQSHKGKVFLKIDPAISLIAFKKAFALNPEDIEVALGLGYAFIQSGDNKSAVTHLNKLIKDGNNKNPSLRQALAIALGNIGEYSKALGEMNELAKLRNYNYQDYQIMGDLWLNQDSIDFALAQYETSIAMQYNPESAFGQAVCQFLKDKPQVSIEILESIPVKAPGFEMSPYQNFVKAMAYYNMGKLDEFNQSIEGAVYGKNREVGKLLVMAMRAISQFNYGVAKKCLNKASRLDADNINVMLVKGSLEFQFGNYDETAESFSQGLSMDPGNVELKNIYALVLSELQGRGEEAISLMKEVIHDRPSARYFNNMGLIYSNVGQFLKDQKSTFACDYFEMAESYMDSALAAGISPAFGVNKGNYRLDMQDTVSARAFFNQYSNQFSINNQGIISELEGNRTQAVNYVEQAIQVSEPYVCPIISLNLEKLNGQAGSQYKNEGPMLIYLYQIMPGILPDKHQFSYSFNMEPGTPVHYGGDYLVYSNLKGELMDGPSIHESAEPFASK